MRKHVSLLGLLFCVTILISGILPSINANAANYPLEITNIKPAGTGSPAISSNNRIFRAYPGIEYNIRAAVIRGSYPYTFSLTNAPSGMTIARDWDDSGNGKPGEIRWTPPSEGTYGPITLSVTDSENTTVTTTWSINVTTNNFVFIDANNGSASGDGTIINPYQDIANLYGTDGESPVNLNYIIYFREGTYNIIYTVSESRGFFVGLLVNGKANKWIGYPGESAIINMNDYYIVSYNKTEGYFDNLTFTNITNWCFRVSSPSHNYFTLRRSKLYDLVNTLSGNGNQGFLYLGNFGNIGAYYNVVQDNEIYDFDSITGIGSLYNQRKMLIEDNHIYNGTKAIGTKLEIFALTIRHNRIHDVDSAFGTAANSGFYDSREGQIEINYNLIYNTGTYNALALNGDGQQGITYFYRNTVIGRFMFQRLDGVDGPFYLSDNVIINDDGSDHLYYHYTCSVTGEAGNVFASDNLRDATAELNTILDSNYNLTEAYSSYLGNVGWQLGSSDPVPPPGPAVPSTPTGFTGI